MRTLSSRGPEEVVLTAGGCQKHNKDKMFILLLLTFVFRSVVAFTPISYRNAQFTLSSSAPFGFLQRRGPQTSPSRRRLVAGTALADVSSNDTTTDAPSNDAASLEAASCHTSPDSGAAIDNSSSSSGRDGAPGYPMNHPREMIRRLSAMVSSSTNYEKTLRAAVAAQRLFLESDPTTPSLNSVLLIWAKVAHQLTDWHHGKDSAPNPDTLELVNTADQAVQILEDDRSGNGSDIDSVLDEYLKDVDIREAGVYTSKDAAIQAEALLEQHMVIATTGSFNAAMESWTKSRDEIAPDRVRALFDKIKNPDESSYNALVEAFAYCKNVNDRIILMEGLPVSYAESTRTCNALLHSYRKAAGGSSDNDRTASSYADKALEALEALKANYQKTGDGSQRPDIMSYTTGKKEYALIADKLMNELKEGCKDKNTDSRFNPTIASFTTLLRAWGRVNTPEALARCHEILEESIEWVGPHANVFTCLIQALGVKSSCAKQPAQDALRLLQRMRSLSVEPTIVTYNAALEACAKQGENGAAASLKIAFAIYKATEQPSSLVSPTEWTYSALMSCVGELLPASDERNQIASTIFRKAAAKQMVSKRLLYLLNRSVEASVFYDLLCKDMMPNINKKFDFDNIPVKWSKNAGKG